MTESAGRFDGREGPGRITSDSSLPTARLRTAAWRDASTIAVITSALAFTAITTIWFVFAVHVVKPLSPADIVGWTTLHKYAKGEEILNYVALLCIATASGAFAWFIDRRLRNPARHDARDAVVRIGFAAWMAILLALVALEPRELVWPAWITGLLSVGIAFYLAVRRRAGSLDAATAAPDAFQADSRYGVALGLATLVGEGAIAGWLTPLIASPISAAPWWIFPMIFVAAAAVVGRSFMTLRGSVEAGALIASPVLLLLAVPSAGSLRPAIVVAVILSCIMIGCVLPRIATGTRLRLVEPIAVCTFIAIAGLAAWSQNPALTPGRFIPPLDGDATTDWVSNGLHGRTVFRDFWYPYGALHYLRQLLAARWFGLDRMDMPVAVIDWTISAACAAICARMLLKRSVFAVIAAPVAFLAFLPEPRMWLPLAGVTLVTGSWISGQVTTGFCGALILTMSAFWSAEAFVAAIVTLLFAGAIALAQRPRVTSVRLITSFSIALLVLIGAAVICISVGLLGGPGPLVDSFARTFRTVDVCCAQPYPSLFGGVTSMGAGPTNGYDPRFINFWIVPGIYAVAIILLVYRALDRRRVDGIDFLFGAVAFFGSALFRIPLGRTGSDHLEFAATPAGFLVLGFAAYAVRGRLQTPLSALLAIALVICGWPTQRNIMAERAYEANRYLSTILAATLSHSPHISTGWTTIADGKGETFYFPTGDAADIEAVVAYLRAHLRGGDRIYNIPYAARYDFLLGLTSPGNVGPIMWEGASLPSDQIRLAHTLEHVRFVVYDETEWPSTDGVSWLDRYPIIAQALPHLFHPVAVFGSKIIFERGAPGRPPSQVQMGNVLSLTQLRGGWYTPETIGGIPGRWATPDASLVLDRSGRDRRIVIDYTAVDAQRPLDVTINGIDSGGVTPVTPGVQRVSLSIPVGVPTGPVTIRLTSPQPIDAQDLRLLSVFVQQIALIPDGVVLTPVRAAQTVAAGVAPPSKPPVSIDVGASGWSMHKNAAKIRLVVSRIEARTQLFWLQVIINDQLTGIGGCYVSVHPENRAIDLLTDSGDNATHANIGSARTLQNSQCAIGAQHVLIRQFHGGVMSADIDMDVRDRFLKRPLHLWARAQGHTGDQPSPWIELRRSIKPQTMPSG